MLSSHLHRSRLNKPVRTEVLHNKHPADRFRPLGLVALAFERAGFQVVEDRAVGLHTDGDNDGHKRDLLGEAARRDIAAVSDRKRGRDTRDLGDGNEGQALH